VVRPDTFAEVTRRDVIGVPASGPQTASRYSRDRAPAGTTSEGSTYLILPDAGIALTPVGRPVGVVRGTAFDADDGGPDPFESSR